MNQVNSLTESAATIVIFGASGDLTRRKLVPALHSLACGGLLPSATRVIGVARDGRAWYHGCGEHRNDG